MRKLCLVPLREVEYIRRKSNSEPWSPMLNVFVEPVQVTVDGRKGTILMISPDGTECFVYVGRNESPVWVPLASLEKENGPVCLDISRLGEIVAARKHWVEEPVIPLGEDGAAAPESQSAASQGGVITLLACRRSLIAALAAGLFAGGAMLYKWQGSGGNDDALKERPAPMPTSRPISSEKEDPALRYGPGK